ncbi:MAG: EcsC family protein [Eubacteriales bacterium]|nr:EcsC family protein [Eubacteriales bacterium]
MKRNLWEKEWDDLVQREAAYVEKNKEKRGNVLAKLQRFVPDGLQSKLDMAFTKAFQLIFEKGTAIIEKTYDKQRRQDDYEIAEFAAGLRENKRHVRAFRKQAKKYARRNLLVSSAEGIGLGLLGIGLPDIPLFVSLLLKNLYEISLSFGYEYDQTEERLFQLKIIETALYSGEEMEQRDSDMNTMCESIRGAKKRAPEETQRLTGRLDEQIRSTAKALSDEMLYAKFLQGTPVVGVVGGAGDMVVLKRVTDYAMLKYRRRYLIDRKL